ncbi:hypothetical protein phi16_gp015 [Corynebacterium phage phi16]|nr:hypothetical protein phi16_gp015 [Corynebacterium phage phi16]
MELDFVDLGFDLRDWWRPGGGSSQMTTRRVLLLVDGLPKTTSRFWCTALEVDPLSDDQWLLSDIYTATTGKAHPIRTRKADREERRRIAEKKARIKRRDRRRKKLWNL